MSFHKNESGNDTAEEHLRSILIITSSTCSVAGACVIIASFLLVRSVRTASRCIVVIMAIADIMVALPALLSEIISITDSQKFETGKLCKIQSFFTTVGAQVSMIWTAGLAQHMFILVACRKEAVKGGFMILIVLTLAVTVENVYLYYVDILGGAQNATGLKWCWIKIEDNKSCSCKKNCNWMLWDGKVLEISMYLAVFIYYFLLYTKVKHLKTRNDLASSSLVTVIAKTGKIVAIPFVFVLVRLWGTLVTLWLIQNNCHRPIKDPLFDAFLVLMAFFDMSQGWVNFILYFLTTRQEINLADRLKLVMRSLPYMAKTRRPHCSENSYLTVNESGGRRSRSSLTVGNTVSSSRGGGSRTYSSSPNTGRCVQRHGSTDLPLRDQTVSEKMQGDAS